MVEFLFLEELPLNSVYMYTLANLQYVFSEGSVFDVHLPGPRHESCSEQASNHIDNRTVEHDNVRAVVYEEGREHFLLEHEEAEAAVSCEDLLPQDLLLGIQLGISIVQCSQRPVVGRTVIGGLRRVHLAFVSQLVAHLQDIVLRLDVHHLIGLPSLLRNVDLVGCYLSFQSVFNAVDLLEQPFRDFNVGAVQWRRVHTVG